jgi:hypothetical protein
MMFQAMQQSQEIHPDSILIWVTESVIGGLIVSHASLWLSHMKHKTHIAENYVAKPDIAKLDKSMSDMNATLLNILAIVHELKGRAQGTKNE